MNWELIDKKHASRGGMYQIPKRSETLEYGYLTANGGMRVVWHHDFDGLETARIIASIGMSQEEIDTAMEEFRQLHPDQKWEVTSKILDQRDRDERERRKYFREQEKEQERRRKFQAEQKAKQEAEEAELNSRKEKYSHIK